MTHQTSDIMKKMYEKPSCAVLRMENDFCVNGGSDGTTIQKPGAGGGLGVDEESQLYDYWENTTVNP